MNQLWLESLKPILQCPHRSTIADVRPRRAAMRYYVLDGEAVDIDTVGNERLKCRGHDSFGPALVLSIVIDV